MSIATNTYSPKSDLKGESLRVLVGLSGGIHSAVTAALLKTQGHEVVGVHIDVNVPSTLAPMGRQENHCCGGNSKAQAEKTASILGIDLQIVDAADLYNLRVVDYLLHETVLGSFPNPCVPCNREVRIATLFRKAEQLRCSKVATGHGAQLIFDPRTGLSHLLQATDAHRDQSFFLFTLSQKELSGLLLPLGNFPRAMVARLGAEHGFSDESSRSQSICFSGPNRNVSFLESRIAPSLRPKGVIRTFDHHVLGDHQGLHRFCVGEKPDLELSSMEAEDYVVVEMDLANHALVLGPAEQLQKKQCLLTRTNWLKPVNQLKGMHCLARFKPDGELIGCQITLFENDTVQVEFDERQGPLFPGQAIVFYQENEVLGGGWIHTTS